MLLDRHPRRRRRGVTTTTRLREWRLHVGPAHKAHQSVQDRPVVGDVLSQNTGER